MKVVGIPSAESNQLSNVESPAVPPVVSEPPKEDPLSSKYAELAKREKILRNKIQAREEALKTREAAIQAKEAEYASSYVPKSKIKELFKNDPYQAMKDFDISGDELTQGLLNQPSPEARQIQQLQAKLTAMEENLGKTQNTFKERDEQARQQALNQIKMDVKRLIETDEAFDTVKNTNSEDEVVAYLEKKFNETGELIPIEQAAAAVEQELIEELFKYSQLKKIQEKFKAPAEVKAETTKSVPTPSKTLAHAQVSSGSKSMGPRERAIALLEGRNI